MKDKEKLYETLGELLYAVAIADGVIQPSETDRLKEIVEHHSWGKVIKWSFDYESRKQHTFKEENQWVLLQKKENQRRVNRRVPYREDGS